MRLLRVVPFAAEVWVMRAMDVANTWAPRADSKVRSAVVGPAHASFLALVLLIVCFSRVS